MKITRLELHNFKRFTKLTLDAIPASARLVLLIGSNGSGKSSVFDAFEALNKAKKEQGLKNAEQTYYRKVVEEDFKIVFDLGEGEFWEDLMYHPNNLAEYYASKGRAFDFDDYLKQLETHKNAVILTLIPSLALKRTEYPYFGEQAFAGKQMQNRFRNKQENTDQASSLAMYIHSDDFETWYKVFPMKSYATDVAQRQHIPKSDLVKTGWFKSQIQGLLAD